MQAFLDLPQPRNTIADLRAFYDSTESHIRGLLSLGIVQDSYGALLIPVIWGKLPSEVKRNLARENNGSNWSIDQLREALLREIRILEQGASTSCSSITSPKITASFHVGSRSADQHRSYRSERGTNKPITYKKTNTCLLQGCTHP